MKVLSPLLKPMPLDPMCFLLLLLECHTQIVKKKINKDFGQWKAGSLRGAVGHSIIGWHFTDFVPKKLVD
jgi:hypothetical protein